MKRNLLKGCSRTSTTQEEGRYHGYTTCIVMHTLTQYALFLLKQSIWQTQIMEENLGSKNLRNLINSIKTTLTIPPPPQPPPQKARNPMIPINLLQCNKPNWDSAIIVKVLNGEHLDTDQVMRALRGSWHMPKKLDIYPTEPYRFICRFDKPSDLARVDEDQPWQILGYLLLIKPFKELMNPQNVIFDVLPIWMGFRNLHHQHFCYEVVRFIASNAGEVDEVRPVNLIPRTSDGFRARVFVQINKPLMQNYDANLLPSGSVLVQFVYYGLPASYCTRCFRLGHDFVNCGYVIAPPLPIIQLPPDLWETNHEPINQTPQNNYPILSPIQNPSAREMGQASMIHQDYCINVESLEPEPTQLNQMARVQQNLDMIPLDFAWLSQILSQNLSSSSSPSVQNQRQSFSVEEIRQSNETNGKGDQIGARSTYNQFPLCYSANFPEPYLEQQRSENEMIGESQRGRGRGRRGRGRGRTQRSRKIPSFEEKGKQKMEIDIEDMGNQMPPRKRSRARKETILIIQEDQKEQDFRTSIEIIGNLLSNPLVTQHLIATGILNPSMGGNLSQTQSYTNNNPSLPINPTFPPPNNPNIDSTEESSNILPISNNPIDIDHHDHYSEENVLLQLLEPGPAKRAVSESEKNGREIERGSHDKEGTTEERVSRSSYSERETQRGMPVVRYHPMVHPTLPPPGRQVQAQELQEVLNKLNAAGYMKESIGEGKEESPTSK